MFAYCNNSPLIFIDESGSYCTYAVQETDTGGGYRFPDVVYKDENSEDFYCIWAKYIVENYSYSGYVASVDIRYEGVYKTRSFAGDLFVHVLQDVVSPSIAEGLAVFIGDKLTGALLFGISTAYYIVDEAVSIPLPRGNYDVYVVVATDYFGENGVRTEETVFFTFYHSKNCLYYEKTVYYSHP